MNICGVKVLPFVSLSAEHNLACINRERYVNDSDMAIIFQWNKVAFSHLAESSTRSSEFYRNASQNRSVSSINVESITPKATEGGLEILPYIKKKKVKAKKSGLECERKKRQKFTLEENLELIEKISKAKLTFQSWEKFIENNPIFKIRSIGSLSNHYKFLYRDYKCNIAPNRIKEQFDQYPSPWPTGRVSSKGFDINNK